MVSGRRQLSELTRSDVRIAVSENFRDAINEVHRYDDQLMKMAIVNPIQRSMRNSLMD